MKQIREFHQKSYFSYVLRQFSSLLYASLTIFFLLFLFPCLFLLSFYFFPRFHSSSVSRDFFPRTTSHWPVSSFSVCLCVFKDTQELGSMFQFHFFSPLLIIAHKAIISPQCLRVPLLHIIEYEDNRERETTSLGNITTYFESFLLLSGNLM